MGNVFPIPNEILIQIHKKTFNDFWQNKSLEKNIFLQKEKGRLNIKEPETQDLSMRLKHILKVKDNENQPPWTYSYLLFCLTEHIATYRLAKDITSDQIINTSKTTTVKTTNQKKPFLLLCFNI